MPEPTSEHSTDLPVIASFWTGDPLSLIERLCLKSYVDAGHRTILYSYEPIGNVPDGVEQADANDILPEPAKMLTHERTQSPAPFADRFRYNLLAKRPGIIWVDCDAYCLKPFTNPTGWFMAYGEEQAKQVAIGVLAMPHDSQALAEMIAWCEDEYAVLPWLPPQILDQACRAARDGTPMHVSEFTWAAWGPPALTWVLRMTGELEHAMPFDTLYPFGYPDRRIIFKAARNVMRTLTDDTMSIHFYGRRIRDRLFKDYDGVPPAGSILHRLAEKHELEPV